MKILFVSALLPYPLYSGGQIRIYNLIKTLSKTHEITLFSFIREQKELEFKGKLSFCQRVETVFRGHAWQPRYITRAVFGLYPLLYASYDNREMRSLLAAELTRNHYDLVHIEPGYIYPSIPTASLPIVVAEHNIESSVYEGYVRRYPITPLRPFLYTDVLKIRYWEKQVWKRAHHIVAVSSDDANEIHKINPNVSVVPNGIDPHTFPFKPKSELSSKSLIFLFVGNFSWIQNRDALRHLLRKVWPSVQRAFPESRLRVVGKQMPDDLKRLAGAAHADLLENVDDISKEYELADIMLAPIRIGGGTKFKILEAMASGIPVISTESGIKGLEVGNHREIMIADSGSEVIRAISELRNNVKRKSIITAARNRVESLYTWERIAKKLESVWLQTHEND